MRPDSPVGAALPSEALTDMASDNLLRVLLAHHSSHEAECLLNVLRKGGYATRPVYVDNADDIPEVLAHGMCDLVLSAGALGDHGLESLMSIYFAARKDLPVIIVSPTADEDMLVMALRHGARDCISGDRPRHLLEAVRRELAELEQRRGRRLAESTLREYKRRNAALLAASREAVAFVLDGMHIHANAQYAHMFGLDDPADLAQVPVMDLVDEADRTRFRDFLKNNGGGADHLEAIEITALRGGGDGFAALFAISPSVYEGEACLQMVATSLEPVSGPVTEAPPPAPAAATDPVEHLLEVLEERVMAAIRGQRRSCLVYLGIDDFTDLCRGLGVAESHRLVRDITATLRQELAGEALVTRCGDSAIALLLDRPDAQETAALGRRIREMVCASHGQRGGRSLALTCSFGVVAITELTPSGQAAFDWAVEACRLAATKGGDRLVAHEAAEPRIAESRNRALVKRVQGLIRNKRDVISFRPIVGLHGHRREFYEVMPHLRDRDGRPYATGEIYQAVEDAGVAARFDQWMLERVVELTREITRQGRDISFILGFSDGAMGDENRVLSVAKSLKSAGLDGTRLIFRLSEMAAATNVKPARSFVNGLHELNCKVALTHFGSGLTPFRILDHVDADYLAFDAAFIQDITRNVESRQAVELLCGETKRRSKFTLAPGVRDADTLAVLWQCGVDYASGDYLQEAGPEMNYDFMAEA